MSTATIFVSSVQKELAEERRAIGEFVRGDALLRRFFDVFLFEDLPALDRRSDDVYLDEVGRCALYVGLFGRTYGEETAVGRSPTEREFDQATALVQHLEDRELIRTGPFDAVPCPKASLADLDAERMRAFLARARSARGFPLSEDAAPEKLLTHLNLLDDGRPTNAAVLLFGKQPQRFLISSEVKCAHFHGTEVTKPIPSYQVYKGTVFELVDQAVDFVMSKINLAVGTRAHSTQVPVAYEIPPEVVREAIVNAVAHRDYTSNGSVQVMLFADRLEVWNPGHLPPSLTLEMLRHPHGSVPGNPLLAEPLYLAKYIERMGTGTGDMIARCRKAGLPEPKFALRDGFVVTLGRRPQRAFEAVSPGKAGTKPAPSRRHASAEVSAQVTAEVAAQVLAFCREPRPAKAIMSELGLKHWKTFQSNYLNPILESGWIERTIPDKPRSSRQRYRLTRAGAEYLKKMKEK